MKTKCKSFDGIDVALIFVIGAIGFSVGYISHFILSSPRQDGLNRSLLPARPAIIEQVKTLQRQVDCRQIDGVIGRETMRLVNEAAQKELFNQFAEKYYTETGSPK